MDSILNKSPLYARIADLLQVARQSVTQAVNRAMVVTYFEIGRMVVEDEQEGRERADYGKQVLDDLSADLTRSFGRGFSVVNLRQMRAFYLAYSIQQTASAKFQLPDFKLSWSHYLKLMRIENPGERSFYEIECAANRWSLKELQRQFDSALYERLALSRDKAGVERLSQEGQIVEKPTDFLKDPYVLEFLDLADSARYSESELEAALIDKLEHFLLELGKGFTFAGRQVRLTFDEKHFRVDLVFYNRLLKCFVLIDLRIGELTHQDIGQMMMYVNYHDRYVKLRDENKTIGIILCKDKNESLVEITLPETNDQIYASRYQTVLPDKQTFIRLLDEEMGNFE